MSKPVFRLYTRNECHLCDVMKTELRNLQYELGFGLEVHDVDAREEFRAKYNDLVPILLWGQDVICYHELDRNALDKVLAAYS